MLKLTLANRNIALILSLIFLVEVIVAQKKIELQGKAHILTSKIISKKVEEFTIFGVSHKCCKYHVRSKILVQVRESFLRDRDKFSYRTGQFLISVFKDSSFIILDSMI